MFTPVETSIGALLLAQATTTLLFNNGRVLGASSIMAGALFNPDWNNLSVITGVGLSAMGVSQFVPWLLPNYDNVVEIFGSWTWILAGLLVGMGTKYSNGCTSGHLLCGVSLGSLRSIVASAIFSATAVITATFSFKSYPPPCAGPCYMPAYPSEPHIYTLLWMLVSTTLISYAITYLPASSRFSQPLTSAWSGFLFGLGLIVTGMASPSKPLGFLLMILDGGQRWDPSLALVLLFAGLPNFFMWRVFMRRNQKPILSEVWRISERKDIDFRLLTGAAVFGVGWGMLGVCPGAGIVTGFLEGWRGVTWLVGFLGGYGLL